MGYIAFRIPRDQITIAHLVVHPERRGHGAARALLVELRRRFEDRRGMLARCRRDYPVNNAWPRLGFVALGNRPGRSAQGHLLTDWWFDFGREDLLTWAGSRQTTVPVVIDANVFIALHGQTPDAEIVSCLAALEDRTELLVTPELSNEINRLEDRDERERLLHLAQQYPRLSVDPHDVSSRESEITRYIGGRPSRIQDLSDITHLAYAWSAGIEILVTDDRKANTRLKTCASDLAGITITSSRNLVSVLDDREGDPTYTPRALKQTGYTLGETKSDGGELPLFIHTATGERRSDYVQLCDRLAAARPYSRRIVVRTTEERPVALAGVVVSTGFLEVWLLRTIPGQLQNSIAAQLVGHLRSIATEFDVTAVLVQDQHIDAVTLQALVEDGYHRYDGGLVGLTLTGSHDTSEVRSRVAQTLTRLEPKVQAALDPIMRTLEQLPSPLRAFQLEHQLRPLRFADQPLDSWLLPIKPAYAMDLFGYPPQLFDRPDSLGMSREHVFFRGQRSGETSPGRILWYASHPESRVFAVSSIVDVEDLPARVAYRNYQRLGVYTLQRLEDTADPNGYVRAIRVTDTEVLDHPVDLPTLQAVAKSHDTALQLWSATRLPPAMFAHIMRKGIA